MARKSQVPHPAQILAIYAFVVGPRTTRAVKLAVDTGATYTMLPPELLLDIGHDRAHTNRHVELSTANGLLLAPLLRIRTIRCLGLSLNEVEIVAHHLPSESPVEGLLGLNVLTRFKPFQAFFRALRPFSV